MMSRKLSPVFILFSLVILMACGLVTTPEAIAHATLPVSTSTANLPAANPSVPASANPTPIQTATSQPSQTSTTAPSAVPLPGTTQPVAAGSLPGLISDSYTDDRSTPASIIISLFNAINRHEYLRAYSYWQDPAKTLGTLNVYANGYANTASVDLSFGQITSDGAAGHMYYTVPVIIKGTVTNGQKANFAACYLVQQIQPGVQGVPPFTPMAIMSGNAAVVSLTTSDADALAQAYTSPIGSVYNSNLINPLDVGKNNFLDNRSGPVEVVASLLNALNRKEYVRAYSYWENPAKTVGPFDAYANGYNDTETIAVNFGPAITTASGGQYQFKVPTAMKVVTTTGSTQTFIGCYYLHLSQPAVQSSALFQPSGLTAGKFKKIDNQTDTAPLLNTACN